MTVRGVPTDEITLEVKKADGEKKTITYEPTVTTRYMMGFNYDDCDRGMEFTYVQQKYCRLPLRGVCRGATCSYRSTECRSPVWQILLLPDRASFDGSAVTLEYEHSGKTKEITVTPVENTYAKCTVFVSAPGETVPDRRAEIQRAGDQILGAHRH